MDPLRTQNESLAAQAVLAGASCPTCGGVVTLGSPHVIIGDGAVRVYCSAECRRQSTDPGRTTIEDSVPRGPGPAGRLFILGVGLAGITPCALRDQPTAPVVDVAAVAVATEQPDAEPPPVYYGPPAPTDREVAEDFAATLAFDTWVHPLSGPKRRMPIRQSRAFGAARDGNRPHECRAGHCGVDLGGQVWGEPVYAVHDAVIDKVNRDPNRSGGKYIRLSHRNGTVFTEYFHLAAIPKRFRAGRNVRTGQVIGLLGETGVEHSGPHLHFTVAVRPDPELGAIFIDPEPLVALWPLAVPRIGGDADTAVTPGVPVAGRARQRRHRRARARRAKARRAEVRAANDNAAVTSQASPSISEPPGGNPRPLDN